MLGVTKARCRGENEDSASHGGEYAQRVRALLAG